MDSLHIQMRIDSETVFLAQLRDFFGKNVEITIAESEIQNQPARNWTDLVGAANADLVDPDVYVSYREFENANISKQQ